MDIKKENEFICNHPPENLFEQINNSANYNLIICRNCGKVVERKYKKK